ncbi:MAG TPA: DNA polymerase III subunit delta [Gemmatimonadaceae bacterium]|nr:DNA polymerase III subunit delta [Gemmatimonadaceae bacterium]
MSVAAQRALRSAIDHKTFDLVYYLHGDDDFRKDEAVTQLVSAAADAATRDFNVDVFRGGDADAAQVATAVRALPMLAERRVVVIRDVDALNKAARAEVNRYVTSPARETLLVLTSVAGAKCDAELARAATAVPFEPLDADKVAPWLTQRARTAGAELSAEAAALLAEAVGSDLAHATGELDKLASFANGRAIDVADVEAIVGMRRGETAGDLLDAVAARDASRAIPLVELVLAQPKSGAVPLVMWLTAQALGMAWGRAAYDRGLPASRLEAEFFKLLKSGSAWPGRPWGEAVKCWARNLSKWSGADLDRAIALLLATDLALKDTRVSPEESVIASLVLSLCTPTRRRVAA